MLDSRSVLCFRTFSTLPMPNEWPEDNYHPLASENLLSYTCYISMLLFSRYLDVLVAPLIIFLGISS